jgi:hypothetical protein
VRTPVAMMMAQLVEDRPAEVMAICDDGTTWILTDRWLEAYPPIPGTRASTLPLQSEPGGPNDGA